MATQPFAMAEGRSARHTRAQITHSRRLCVYRSKGKRGVRGRLGPRRPTRGLRGSGLPLPPPLFTVTMNGQGQPFRPGGGAAVAVEYSCAGASLPPLLLRPSPPRPLFAGRRPADKAPLVLAPSWYAPHRLRCVERDQGARTHSLPRVRVPSHVQEAHQAQCVPLPPRRPAWTAAGLRALS